uniref:Uncharacterized protein ycf35 n=1 Tax=Amicula sp. isolate GU52X-4 cfCalB7 TaxID=3003489 RepID=A0A9E8Z0S0_9STRA|nr:hypothetical chloroplast RF35 [Amicula sp. isolate GU52X-4 cfCalB7]WAK84973.1 hypothetical chloroplast RF35 [Amicula sp. isolate GU52X-4 cfCalB7]
MSHFTHMKTHFKNLFYLKTALNKLNIKVKEQEGTIHSSDSELINKSLIISQSNGYNVEFVWNNEEYELVSDISFWEQPYSIETFIDKVSQQYANEVIIGEGQKIGFQHLKSKQFNDGSKRVVLQRWNNNK